MNGIIKGMFGIFLALICLILITAAWDVYYITMMKWTMDENVIIKKGDRVEDIIDAVKPGNKFAVKVYLRLSGNWKKLKPGSYILKGDYTINEMYNIIASGKSAVIKLVIPEGYTVKMVKNAAVEKGLVTGDEFDTALKNYSDFPYPHENNNYEGYCYPATYDFYAGIKADEIIRTILTKFLEEFPPEDYPDREDFYKKLVMASIIEKEAYHADEKKVIASVFYNRLNKGQRLESCATVEYLYDYSKEKLYYKNLKIDSPYNTYTKKGLPPAPISNPSKSSFEAAANPENTEFFYFVAQEDRHHIFSKTYKEHLKAQAAGQ